MKSLTLVNSVKSTLAQPFRLALTAAILTHVSLAQASSAAASTGNIITFFNSLNSLLNTISIVVVAVAIMFAGYQISFNSKRIQEVMPAFLGAVLVGASLQIASLLVAQT